MNLLGRGRAGIHPFPFRTQLSLAGAMIPHGQLGGNVGHRRIKLEEAGLKIQTGLSRLEA